MPKFDATINGISLASYGVEPNMATVPQPEAKTYQAEIPGRDGLLDYTDAYGVVRYENRTVTVEAYEIGDITARMEHRRAICSDMHGKTCTLELTTLPGYAFTGRCSVEYDEDGSETAYKLSFDCQPYMSAGERTFVGNCAGGVDLVFMSGDKPVKPRIEVPRRSIIIFNGRQYEVEAGTWTFDGIVFKRGRNELYINTYTEPGTTTWGDLESMTWEQIGWHHKQDTVSGSLVNVTDALQARPNNLVVDGKAVQDGTPTPDAPVDVDVVDSPVTVKVADASQALINQQNITLPPDHNYLASLPDGTRDELQIRSDGVAVLIERVGKNVITGGWSEKQTTPFVHYFKSVGKRADPSKNIVICNAFKNGSSSADSAYISNYGTAFYLREPSIASDKATLDSWSAANPVEYYYVLQTSNTRYSADNGATWSVTDPATGTSAVPLHKGTNNVWCTDALSPNVTLNYDTQERTRKQRVSELYWRKNQPQRRLTWGQLATHTWGEIGSKSVQEWYYSGTSYVVENAYINYEIGDL